MRYFINIVTTSGTILDNEGAEFDDLQSAEAEAAQSGRDLIAEELRSGRPIPLAWRAQIACENGTVVRSIPFATLVFGGARKAFEQPVKGNSFDSFAALYAQANATAQRSRLIGEEICATISAVRGQLRKLASHKPDIG